MILQTCRVLIIDWKVRGLYRCLWYARGLCHCPCVITPRGFTSLPSQEAEYSLLGFNKQTNKQTNITKHFLPLIFGLFWHCSCRPLAASQITSTQNSPEIWIFCLWVSGNSEKGGAEIAVKIREKQSSPKVESGTDRKGSVDN